MTKLNPDKILKRVEKEGFESVWKETTQILPKAKSRLKLCTDKRGVSHPLFDLLQKMRQSFLSLGFMELSNPVVTDEKEVYKQYGSEAPIILDRCYYLATLPRPDIGLSRAKRQTIASLGVELTKRKIAALQEVLRAYKKAEIASDDFVEEISKSLGIFDDKATRILSEVFPEFAALKPQPSALTLRSHMTSAWFLTLQALQHKLELPLKLFSVDIRFRREQREDSTHLRAHHAASCVVMDEGVDVRDGEEITRALLEPLGFEQFRFAQKKVTSRYYAPGTEYEGYIFHPDIDDWIEIANYGVYNPIALARYGLEYPVLNVGVGVERVALVLYGETDVRSLAYPQFFGDWELTDVEIAKMVGVELEPKSEMGKKLREKIKSVALEHADAMAPCEFLAYEGEVLDKPVKVYVYETDKGARLLGPAAQNLIYVYDGNVLGVPEKGMEDVAIVKKARERGVPTRLSYLEAVASLAAAKVEEAVESDEEAVDVRVRIAKRPGDVNIRISDVARRYVTGKKRKIDVAGPVFIGARAEIAEG